MNKNDIYKYLNINTEAEDDQKGSQPTSQPVSQPQEGSQPTSQPQQGSQPAKGEEQGGSQPASQAGSQPQTQEGSQPASQPASQASSQPASQSSSKAVSQATSQPTSTPAEQEKQMGSKPIFKGNNFQSAAAALDEEQAKSQPISSAQSPTIVISAFVCAGKSTWTANNDWVKDLDSMIYSKKPDGTRSEEFPGNYIDSIRWQLSNCNWKYLLVSSHKEVRDKLREAEIKFYLFYPALERKEEIIKLCQERGNDAQFIQLVQENYENWVSEMSKEENAYALQEGEFLSDELFEKKYKFLKQ